MSKLNDLSIGDLTLLSELPRYPSMRAWASKNRLSPIAASRLVKKVEDALGIAMVKRSNIGITVTSEGEQVAKKAAQLIHLATRLNDVSSLHTAEPYDKTFVFASRGFLNAELAGNIAECFRDFGTGFGVRFVDLSPEETIDAMRSSFVDFALNLEELTLGKTWQTTSVGQLRWGLYCRRQHPLTFGRDTTDLAKYRLGHHAYWNGKTIVSNEGSLNASLGITHRGYGAQTAFSALSICAKTDQLAYVPRIAARLWTELLLVEEIQQKKELRIPVWLAVETTRVPKALYVAITQKIADRLAADGR